MDQASTRDQESTCLDHSSSQFLQLSSNCLPPVEKVLLLVVVFWLEDSWLEEWPVAPEEWPPAPEE